MGKGLLSRLYLFIQKFSSNEKPPILVSKDFKTLRAKTEKSFPEIPDYSKVIIVILHEQYISISFNYSKISLLGAKWRSVC
jgi:hypothetical protein